MPEASPIVRINIDSVEEIKNNLHGVGPILAERIVDYRNTHHYFLSSDDLLNIKGVSRGLSDALAPHIDWRLPNESEERKKRSYLPAIFALLGLGGLIWYIGSIQLPNYYSSFYQLLIKSQYAWYTYAQETALMVSIFTGVIIFLFIAIESLICDLKWAKRINNAYFVLFVVLIFSILASYIISTIILSLNNHGQLFINNTFLIHRYFAIGEALLLGTPFILAKLKPSLINNLSFTRIFDIVIAITSIFFVLYVWHYRAGSTCGESYIGHVSWSSYSQF